MNEGKTVKVYLFARHDGVREIAPRHMWGTLEAIAGLHGCAPNLESAREVDASLLEHGFLFGDTHSVAIHIDEAPSAS
jgi:hypothetical protein